MDQNTYLDRLTELTIIHRAQLKELVQQLPAIREELRAQIEKRIEQTEPEIRRELESFVTAKTDEEMLRAIAHFDKQIRDAIDATDRLANEKIMSLMAEKKAIAELIKKAQIDAETNFEELTAEVKKLIEAGGKELAEETNRQKLFLLQENKTINPRGKWDETKTYEKLDLVTYNGSSFVANETIQPGTKPTFKSPYWTLIARRGGGGGIAVTSLPEIVGASEDGQLLIGDNGNFTKAFLTAGYGVNIITGPGSIQIETTGFVIFEGAWNASTNTPALASGVGVAGHYYVVSVAGSTNLNGITDWQPGDWAIFNGTAWEKVDNSEIITSVNGQTGVVVLTKSDVGLGNVSNDAQLKIASNLSDLNNTTTARSNLGLGGSAVLNVGTGAGTVAAGDDARLSDTRTPTDGTVTDAKIVSGGLSTSAITGTAVITSDARLSDARTPTAHAASHVNGTDDIQDATASQKGLATATQITKLDGITAGANIGITQLTGDVTAGPGGNSQAATLANTAVTPAAYGSATQVGTFTVDAKGRLTAAASVTATPAFSSIQSTPTTLSGYGITDAVNTSALGAANGVATLDSSSKLTASQIPDIAVTDYLGASADQAAMLALSGQKGDWTTRTDLGTVWVITGNDPTQLADWTQLSYPTAPVTSVAGKTGAVTLVSSDVGLGNVTNDAQLKIASNLSDVNDAATARSNLGAGTVNSVDLGAGTGISLSGGPITASGVITVTNTAPDQTVVLNDGTGITTSGSYPNFTITNSAPDQTVSLTAGTSITISGTYPAFTITNTDPDQTVVLNDGTGITTSGTYPNFTITNSAPDETVVLTAGTSITISGTYPAFTITNTDPDQTVVLSDGTGISTSGTYPNFTITNSAPDQTVAIAAGTGISVTGTYPSFTISSSGGSGDVVGPASATDNAVVRFDSTTGKLIQNSGVSISDANLLTTTDLTVNDDTVLGSSNTDTVNFNARVASDINPSADDTYDLGVTGHEWRNLNIDGTANIDSLVADTADVNGGTIDGATIGATTPSTGAFTTLSASGNGAFGGATNTHPLNVRGATGFNLQVRSVSSALTLQAANDADSASVAMNLLASSFDFLDDALVTRAKITSTGLNSTAIGATTPSTVAATTISASGTTTVGPNNAGTGVGLLQLLGGSGTNGGASVRFGTNGTAYSEIGQASGILGGTSTDLLFYANNGSQNIKFYAGGAGGVATISSTGLNSTAIGATTPSTGAFTTGGYNNAVGDSQFSVGTVAPSVKLVDNYTSPNSSTKAAVLAMATTAGHYGLADGDVMLGMFGASRGNLYLKPNYSGAGTKQTYIVSALDISGNTAITGALSSTGILSGPGFRASKTTATSGLVKIQDEGANVYNVIGSRNNADSAALPLNFQATNFAFNGAVAVTGALSTTGTITSGSTISLNYSAPRLEWYDTSAGADSKRWDILSYGGIQSFRLINDANSAASTWLQVNRTGYASAIIAFTGNTSVTGAISQTSPAISINNVSAGINFGSGATEQIYRTGSALGVYVASTTVSLFSATGLAVTGALSCTGAISKGSGSFRIEHPLPSKSATHELVHSFIEGPKCDLIYRGKIDLVDGKATVNIDTDSTMTEGTFEALCATVQCFTSNESGWGAIRGKVVGNILTIEAQDAASTDSVSWMVIGERKDKHIIDTDWTDENGRPIVEPLKPVVESK